MPQYIEFFDNIATRYFLNTIHTDFPDVIFITSKVYENYGQISGLIQDKYVYVDFYILARRIELPVDEIFSGEKILLHVKKQFHFEPQVISFRAHSRIDKNRPIEATCVTTQISKLDWTAKEISACDRFSFKELDWDKKRNAPEVYPVPFPAKLDLTFRRLPELTNFKDFSLLDEIIMELQ